MTAILGRIAFDRRPVNEQVFRHAFDALRPSRSVRSDLSLNGACAMGHHDIVLGIASPQLVTEGRLTLVADARIYNRDDVAGALACSLNGTSDAHLILRAFTHWGPQCLQRINGDFGIAIYDADKRELFLARDHIGARPLFWTRRGNEVLFATLLHGLTAFYDLQWPLSETRIARYLRDPHDFRLESFLEGVEAVGPGEWLRISSGKVTRQRWWNIDVIAQRTNITPAEAQREICALTDAAIRARLPCNAPVGTHFSGGIDSTLVTIMASKALRERGSNLTAAYTWSPPVDEKYPDMGTGDERRVITAQCAQLGIPVRFGSATPETFELLVAQPMELQGTADLMDELPIIEQANGDGLGVMLSGWGGDEVFSSHGFGHVAWLLRRGRLRTVLRLARRNGGGLRRPHRMAGVIWRAGIVPMLPEPLYRQFQPFADLYGDGAFPSAQITALSQDAGPSPAIRLFPDADVYMRQVLQLGHLSERMATWATWCAPAGFEYRYPLLDRNLLEFMLSLPPDIRFGDGSGRYLVSKAFKAHLPKGVKKNDPANEKLRLRNRLGWWQMLAADAAQGRFDEACPWLDMDALKVTVQTAPPKEKLAQISAFARIFVATRIHAMHARVNAKRPGQGTDCKIR